MQVKSGRRRAVAAGLPAHRKEADGPGDGGPQVVRRAVPLDGGGPGRHPAGLGQLQGLQ